MNFRSYNHFLEFPINNRKFAPGMIDTRRTRRVPGRGFRGDSRAAGWRPGGLRLGRTRGTWRNRRHPGKTHSTLGYTAHSGFREVFGSLGTRGGSEGSRRKGFRSALGDRWQTRATSGGNPSGAGYSGTQGSSGRIREVRCFARHSGTRGRFRGRFEEGFRRNSRQGFGDISRFRRSPSAQPSGHVARSEGRTEGFCSKACRKGLSEKWLRADFRDRWHSPKGGPAEVSAESSKRGLRQGFGKVSKGSEGGSFG